MENSLASDIGQDFSCPVVRIISVSCVEDADRIDIVRALGYQSITPRGRFKLGDLAVLIPDGAVLPADLAASLKGLTKLAGERKNRTKAFKLRGIVSDAVLLGPLPGGQIGQDCAPMLGITKYVEPLPPFMRGECVHMPERIIDFWMRNYRRFPGTIPRGEPVEMTEKVHGTFCAVSFAPGLHHPDLWHGDTLVYSKGLGEAGYAFKDSEANAENLYLNMAKYLDLRARLIKAFGLQPATVLGEIYGGNVQDLTYGSAEPRFAVFDVYLGARRRGRFLNRDELAALGSDVGQQVPVLYRGPLAPEAIKEFAGGQSEIGTGIREGVVVRPSIEWRRPGLGRAIVKYISPEYLTRANGTERQ